MGKRRSKRTANAKQAAPLDNETYAEWRSRVGPSNREKLVLDALSKAGITFDPSNSIDAQWLELLHHRYDDGLDPPMEGDTRASSNASFMSFRRSRIQDTKSRFATERVLSKVRELRSAFLLLKQEIERDDIPSVKLNVALNMLAQLIGLYKEDYEDATDEDIADWIAQPRVNLYVQVSLETDKLRRRLEVDTGFSAARLVTEALRLFAKKYMASRVLTEALRDVAPPKPSRPARR
jgi:hypothetical protein